MSQTMNKGTTLVISRLFDAPRELVYQVFTNPEHVAKWWGPSGFTNTIHEMDVRPGGLWRFIMHGPDGKDYKNRIRFVEVIPAEKLVFNHDDDEGDEKPLCNQRILTFKTVGDKTEVAITFLLESEEEKQNLISFGAVKGGNQTLERWSDFVAMSGKIDEPFTISRDFDTPRELVFQAFTKAEHLAQWWGPKGFDLGVKHLSFEPGGTFHYSMESGGGNKMWGRFTYHEIAPPRSITFVNSFSNEEGGITRAPFSEVWPLEMLVAITLDDLGGKTRLTVRSTPINATAEERATFTSGFESMNAGFNGTLDKLEEYLPRMA